MDDVQRLFNFSSNSQNSPLKLSPHTLEDLTTDSTASIIDSDSCQDTKQQQQQLSIHDTTTNNNDKIKKLADELTYQVLHTIFLGTYNYYFYIV